MVNNAFGFRAGIGSMSVLFLFVEVSMARDFAQAFYHSAAWHQARELVLMRDRYQCVRCKRPAEEVHHIIRLNPDNIKDISITLNPDNLESLCGDCHKKEHEEERVNASLKGTGKSYGDCREGFHFDKNGMLVPDK